MSDNHPHRAARWEAERQAADEPQLAHELGTVVLLGMIALSQMQRITGDRYGLSYSTNFPMSDGRHWRLKIEEMEATDAR